MPRPLYPGVHTYSKNFGMSASDFAGLACGGFPKKNNEKAINFENTCKNHDFNTGGMTVGMGHSTRILMSLSAPGKVLNSHFHILTFSPPV